MKSSVNFGNVQLNDTQLQILVLIKENNKISAASISKELGLSVRTVEKNKRIT